MSCHFSALVLFVYVPMCRVQINSTGMAPQSEKVLDWINLPELHNDLPVTLIHFENRAEDRNQGLIEGYASIKSAKGS